MNKNPMISLMIIAGLIIVAGRWAKRQEMHAKIVIGLFFVALFMTLVNEFRPKFARVLMALIFVGLVLTYIPALLTRLGLMGPGAQQALGAAKAKARDRQRRGL